MILRVSDDPVAAVEELDIAAMLLERGGISKDLRNKEEQQQQVPIKPVDPHAITEEQRRRIQEFIDGIPRDKFGRKGW